jgi:hypothetical protein
VKIEITGCRLYACVILLAESECKKIGRNERTFETLKQGTRSTGINHFKAHPSGSEPAAASVLSKQGTPIYY